MISLVVAVVKNNVIGNNGIIPWKIKGDQKRFKELTIGKTIIIGRKSFEGYPLWVEYFLTERGEKMLEAITIIQNISIELMQENGMEDVLRAKGFID